MTSLLVEFRVASDRCPLVRLTRDYEDVEVEYLDMARTSGDAFLEVFEVRGLRAEAFRDAVMAADGISDVQVRVEAQDRQVCQGVIAVPCIRTLLARHGWMPSKVVAAGGLETISVPVGDLEEARDLVNLVQANYASFELSRINSQGTLGIAPGMDRRAFGLTAKQEEVLTKAFAEGYFDSRRKKSATEIARGLHVNRSTFGRQLKAALKKVLSRVLG